MGGLSPQKPTRGLRTVQDFVCQCNRPLYVIMRFSTQTLILVIDVASFSSLIVLMCFLRMRQRLFVILRENGLFHAKNTCHFPEAI